MYSFVRDEVGKDNANVADFLAIACPIMLIVPPESYLHALGWVQARDSSGHAYITQDRNTAQAFITAIENQPSPATELDLLVQCTQAGYMAQCSDVLIEKLANKLNTIMSPNVVSSANSDQDMILNGGQFFPNGVDNNMSMKAALLSPATTDIQMENMEAFVD